MSNCGCGSGSDCTCGPGCGCTSCDCCKMYPDFGVEKMSTTQTMILGVAPAKEQFEGMATGSENGGKDASCSEMVLSKSGSFPGTTSSRKRRGGLSRFKHEGEGVSSSNSFANQEGESQAGNSTSVSSTNVRLPEHDRKYPSALRRVLSNPEYGPYQHAKGLPSGSSELSTGEIHCEGSDSFARSNGQSDHDNEVGVMEADIIKSPSQSDVANVDAFYVQVDKKDQVEFKYVQDLLKKSEFSGESLPREWYSPYPEVDHSLLHGEAECSNHDSDIARDDPEMSLDHQPGFMHFNSRIRPMPTGYHVLEEVWGNIRWDAECVALELEALIFDDLLREAALDFNGLSISS
ncbi:hypothetical protein J5N97_014976 [Dioscorea zingiberensis]|uniref:Metallothionein-like protein n=1 Tax=Dioscorea zingiberensis TaxID=325984 RepID=A0A9D5HKK5_9LILI|nr:hypothetical protein J5N97_014976 [Dioscorea zingiberensis]